MRKELVKVVDSIGDGDGKLSWWDGLYIIGKVISFVKGKR